jgi:hypothetical protein
VILLTRADVTIHVSCEPEQEPVRGNAMASGDAAVDRETEDAIIAELDRGNEWAWGTVTVRVTWTAPSGREYHGDDHLGCCSYADEAAFREPGGYFDDMVERALDALNTEIAATCADLCSAES